MILWEEIGKEFLRHLELTAISVAIYIVVGVFIGMATYRLRLLRSTSITVTGILQTIPSLAFFGFFIPVLGAGDVTIVFVLVLYGLFPIVQNTVAGLNRVSEEMIDTAKSLGLTWFQTLFKVKLKIATPVILAGIRIAAVTTVGIATIAAFIGGGGLGRIIIDGINSNSNSLILQGALPAAALALGVSILVFGFEALFKSKFYKRHRIQVASTIAVILTGAVGIPLSIRSGNVVPIDLTLVAKDFGEGKILTEISRQLLTKELGLNIDVRTNVTPPIAATLIRNGIADGIPEYTGNIPIIYKPDLAYPEGFSYPDWNAELLKYDDTRIFKFLDGPNNRGLGFDDAYGLAVRTGSTYDVATLAGTFATPGTLCVDGTFSGLSQGTNVLYDFLRGNTGTPTEAQGIATKFQTDLNWEVRSFQSGALRYQALTSTAADNCDAILIYTTDGQLGADQFKDTVKLIDGIDAFLNLYPKYEAGYLFNRATLARFPQIESVLNRVSITTAEMITMNALYANDPTTTTAIVSNFLQSKNDFRA